MVDVAAEPGIWLSMAKDASQRPPSSTALQPMGFTEAVRKRLKATLVTRRKVWSKFIHKSFSWSFPRLRMKFAPVMKKASGEARNATSAEKTSSGSPTRPTGCWRWSSAVRSGDRLSVSFFHSLTSIQPGLIQFTLTSGPRTTMERAWVKATIPPLGG